MGSHKGNIKYVFIYSFKKYIYIGCLTFYRHWKDSQYIPTDEFSPHNPFILLYVENWCGKGQVVPRKSINEIIIDHGKCCGENK
jgi:hypothetical protein